MKKYKDYYYTIKNTFDGYMWTIRNKEREALETSDEFYEGKESCEINCLHAIDEYYR